MKVGDLVYVAYPTPCCGRYVHRNKFYTVTGIFQYQIACAYCGKEREWTAVKVDKFVDAGYQIEMLRVIPPLNELEAEKAVETVNA